MSTKQNAYVNGKIFTSDDSNLYAEAMIVEDGVITWIGKEADMPAGDFTKVDLEGKRVMPGFVDAHEHPVMLSEMSKEISCLPPVVYSIKELIGKIKEVREKQGPGKWVKGWGYDEGKFAEKRSPNRYDLDEGCSDSPVYLLRTCAHIICLNSKALEMAGITKDTPNPEGGEIVKDKNGEPTGVLRENARNLVNPLLPVFTTEQKAELVADLGQLYLSQGITAVCDMGNMDPSDNYPLYYAAVKKGFKQKVGIYYMWNYFHDNPDFKIPEKQFDKNQQIFSAGIKTVGDGSVSGRTAWMNEPYLDSDEYGISTITDEEMESAIAFCKKYHCQLSMHAMGGKTIDRMVNRVYKEEKWTLDDTPHLRMEHITEPSEQAIDRTIEKGFAFATQPIFLYAEIESYLKNLGPERTKTTYPVKTMLEKGVNLCFSTDAPATSWAVPSDPFPCIKGAVTRKAYDGTDCGQEQAVDIETAVKLYTKAAAGVAGFKNIGQLKEGYKADFIILCKDLLNVPSEDIDKVCVEATYIEGEKVYQKK